MVITGEWLREPTTALTPTDPFANTKNREEALPIKTTRILARNFFIKAVRMRLFLSLTIYSLHEFFSETFLGSGNRDEHVVSECRKESEENDNYEVIDTHILFFILHGNFLRVTEFFLFLVFSFVSKNEVGRNNFIYCIRGRVKTTLA